MSIYVGESRGELITWLTELLGPTITKVEQCGKGFTYCQVMDSIYNDLPMSKVKYDPKMEYEYLDNFKILQKSFKQHGVDKPIPVEKLVKCKMQDNLEFLQWLKKFWDTNSRGDGYDAVGRSGYQPPAPVASTSRTTSTARARVPLGGAGGGGARTVSTAASTAQINELKAQLAEMQSHCEAIEKERDFYFDMLMVELRNVEVLVQARAGVEDLSEGEKECLAKVQEILYDTADGFELPEGEQEQGPEEEETF